MRIILKKGSRVHTPYGRQLGSGTEVIELNCKFPGNKKTRIGCGYIESEKGPKKINIARFKLKKYRYDCDLIDCKDIPNIEIIGKKEEQATTRRDKGCESC